MPQKITLKHHGPLGRGTRSWARPAPAPGPGRIFPAPSRPIAHGFVVRACSTCLGRCVCGVGGVRWWGVRRACGKLHARSPRPPPPHCRLLTTLTPTVHEMPGRATTPSRGGAAGGDAGVPRGQAQQPGVSPSDSARSHYALPSPPPPARSRPCHSAPPSSPGLCRHRAAHGDAAVADDVASSGSRVHTR